MTQNKEVMRHIPRLRFPEFQNAPAWEEKRLGDVCELLNGRAYNALELLTDGKYPVLRVGNFFTNNSWYYSDLELEEDKYCHKGDLLYAWSASFGPRLWTEDNTIYHYHIWKIVWDLNLIDRGYLYYLLAWDTDKVKRELSSGGTMFHLTKESMLKRFFSFPDLREQRRIAECLTLLDELIEATVEKAEKLKKYKKGLMQKLFPKEGKTTPRLRFPEFQNAPAWEERKLGEILTVGNGRDYQHLKKGNVPVYGSGGYMLSVNDYLYEGESVCIGRKGTIDKPIFLTGKFWTVDTLFYTHSFDGCLPRFIYNSFLRIDWLKYNIASALPSLSKETINKISIPLPSLPEQKKIAECLSFLNKRIEATSQRVETLKNYKKGLMQKLFPKN